jgi:hypothetical protein
MGNPDKSSGEGTIYEEMKTMLSDFHKSNEGRGERFASDHIVYECMFSV